MIKDYLLLACHVGALGVSGSALDAAGQPSAPEPVVAGPASSVMDLRAWKPETFYDDSKQIVLSLGSAHGSEQQGIFLDAAELYLSHMLLLEAETALVDIEPVNPEHRLRHAALLHATQLLAGKKITEFKSSPLYARDRQDRAFWATLQAISAADDKLLRHHFRESFNGLGQQSRSVLRSVLPVFAEAAIELDQRQLSDAALRLMRELPDLAASNLLHFLTGRAEERRGNQSSALEAYFKAAEGSDRAAARARLAIADMALQDDSEGALLAAKSVMTEGQEAWRGGQLELASLDRLMRIQEALGDLPDSLLTSGKLIARFPNSPLAAASRKNLNDRLSKVYQDGREGALTLTEWMGLHLEFYQIFKTEPSFARHTETLADHLFSLGATSLAGEEYRRSIRLLQDRGSVGQETAEHITRVSRKLAKAQLRGGQFADARATLDLIDLPMTSPHYSDLQSTRTAVLSELGDHEALIETGLKTPSPQNFRKLSQAFAEEERWPEVVDVLKEFRDRHPQMFSAKDAAYLLIAANRISDAETVDKVVRMFPSLSQQAELTKLAQSLQATLPALTPLQADDAKARLERLEEAFERINSIGIPEE